MSSNDAKYVGYMYGGANGSSSTSKSQAQINETSSNMKIQLENWYKTNIRDKGLDEYVGDSIYCNDRSTPGKEATGWSFDTGLGYRTNNTAYGAYARIGANSFSPNCNNPKPTFVCPNKNDAFTKKDTDKGNGNLGEKVGLIIADEVIAAGSGRFLFPNQDYYLYKGLLYWLYSPFDLYNKNARTFIVYEDGSLMTRSVNNNSIGIAPVISLTTEYVSNMIGDGTIGNEYRVE